MSPTRWPFRQFAHDRDLNKYDNRQLNYTLKIYGMYFPMAIIYLSLD